MQLCKLYKYFNTVPTYCKRCGEKVANFFKANLASQITFYCQLKLTICEILTAQILKLPLTYVINMGFLINVMLLSSKFLFRKLGRKIVGEKTLE